MKNIFFSKYFAGFLICAAFLFFDSKVAEAVSPELNLQVALEIPVLEAPGFDVPAGSSSSFASMGNTFMNLFERLGLYGAIYPLKLSLFHLGLSADGMWHYNFDTSRTPMAIGYAHTGVAPSLMIDLIPALYAKAAFGYNRMKYHYGKSDTVKSGTLAEVGAGFKLGMFNIEGAVQNRTGIRTVRYGVLRVGLMF